MMVLDRVTGETEIHPFSDILNYLSPGDAIICNNTRVCRGRMFARKAGLAEGARFEILLVEPFNGIPGEWNCMIKPGKRAKDGVHTVLLEQNGELNSDNIGFTVVERNADDTFHIRFSVGSSMDFSHTLLNNDSKFFSLCFQPLVMRSFYFLD